MLMVRGVELIMRDFQELMGKEHQTRPERGKISLREETVQDTS